MSDGNNRFLRKLFKKLLLKITIWSVSLPLFLLAVAQLVQSADFQWVYDNSPGVYCFLRKFFDITYSGASTVIFFAFVWFVGVSFFICGLLSKISRYINAITKASAQLFDKNVEFIELPPELESFQNQMNYLKRESEKNERLAREAEQRKNDLVVYLAHDLKTPLTSVIGYLTLLRDEMQISEQLRKKYLSISLEKAERLEDLINEFFEITRFNLTDLTLEYSRVNLTRLLEQLIFEFQPMFLEKNLSCTLNAVQNLMVKCDVNKLQRVFDNLLRNAVNYSFQNGRIDILVVQKEGETGIRFSNQGNTIPSEKLERIFEQFYRLDTSRSSSSGGAGLGLAIAKEIIELHNGTITANSQDEVIVFEVTLPVL